MLDGGRSVPVRDGFETPALGSLWEADKIVPADMKLQSAIVRSGRSALQITLHTADVFERGRHGKADSERAAWSKRKLLDYRDFMAEVSASLPKDAALIYPFMGPDAIPALMRPTEARAC